MVKVYKIRFDDGKFYKSAGHSTILNDFKDGEFIKKELICPMGLYDGDLWV